MHTDTTPKEMPTGSANYPARHTDIQIVPDPADPGNKVIITLRARFAVRGHTVHRTNSIFGAVTNYAERWGQVRDRPTSDDAHRFLAQIGGAA